MIERFELSTGPLWVNHDSRTSLRFGEWTPQELRSIAAQMEDLTTTKRNSHEVNTNTTPGGDRTSHNPARVS